MADDTAKGGGAPKGLGMPLDVARQQLLDDQHTQSIAKSLGLELEEYVEMVLDFALHPEKEPVVETLDDESLAALAAELPSQGEILAWMEGVANGTIEVPIGPQAKVEQDDFTTRQDRADKLKQAAGLEVQRKAPVVGAKPTPAPANAEVGSVLKDQLRARQMAAKQAADQVRIKKQPPED